VGGKPVRRSTGKAVDGLPVSPRADKCGWPRRSRISRTSTGPTADDRSSDGGVYRQYAIVSEGHLHDAARKLAALERATGTFSGTFSPSGTETRQVTVR
jgi:hypothetical protein